SVPVMHAFPTAQPGQPPPQSTSVSAPFFTLSMQPGATHIPLVHTPLAQSIPVLQPLPPSHLLGQLPPQSMSVSSPFFAPSVQDGVWHIPPVHTALLQSAALPHILPMSHGV